MTATAPEVIPGVYEISEEIYHADPVPGRSLSSSGARKLLDCPAKFRHQQLHPTPSTKAMELGTAAHQLVLGVGPELVRIDATEWRTNAAKEEVAAVRASGGIPLKPADYKQVHAMATELRRHPVAGRLFAPGTGAAEQTLIWPDRATGVWRRARLDWLRQSGAGRVVVGDYKTTASASERAIQKSVAEYGYHCQGAWYVDGVAELGLAPPDTPMVFVFQEKDPPYLIRVVQLDDMAMHIGRQQNRKALDLYRQCVETDTWPGYDPEILPIGLPAWAEARFLQESM